MHTLHVYTYLYIHIYIYIYKVDRELIGLLLEGKIVMFQLNTGGRHDDILVCLKEDYLKHINKLLNIGSHSTINNANTREATERELLLQEFVDKVCLHIHVYMYTYIHIHTYI